MTSHDSPVEAAGRVHLFGLPLSGFGLFSTLLLSLSAGFLAFFVSCFLAIFGILIYNSAGHHSVNFADSYKYIALPVGLFVLGASFFVLMGLWLRRKLTGK